MGCEAKNERLMFDTLYGINFGEGGDLQCRT